MSTWLTPELLQILLPTLAGVGAFVYIGLSLIVGARLVVGRFAAERLEDESGLPEALDFDSRAWSAMELVRHLALVLAALGVGLAREPLHGAGWALGLALLLVLAARLLVAFVAARAPERVLSGAVPLVALIDRVLGPLFAPLARYHESRVAAARRERAELDEEAREEQLEEVILDAEEDGLLEREQTKLMREIADAGDAVVREIMTPRTEVDAVPAEASFESVVEVFVSSRHSRLPVYEESLDRIVGMLSVRDVVCHLGGGPGTAKVADLAARDIMRPLPLVPTSKKVLELLRELQAEQQQMAVVVDEYGGTAGLVTLEDILEEFVGEIRDEHEPSEDDLRPDGQGGLVAEGLTAIDDLGERLGVDLPDDGVETVGGLVFSHLGRVPRVGDRVEIAGLVLEVNEMDGRRIALVRVTRTAAEQSDEGRPAEETR